MTIFVATVTKCNYNVQYNNIQYNMLLYSNIICVEILNCESFCNWKGK